MLGLRTFRFCATCPRMSYPSALSRRNFSTSATTAGDGCPDGRGGSERPAPPGPPEAGAVEAAARACSVLLSAAAGAAAGGSAVPGAAATVAVAVVTPCTDRPTAGPPRGRTGLGVEGGKRKRGGAVPGLQEGMSGEGGWCEGSAGREAYRRR